MNTPGLFYVYGASGKYHIARTNIADCTTECGVRLVKGQVLVSSPAGAPVCRACEDSANGLGSKGPMQLPHRWEGLLRRVLESGRLTGHELADEIRSELS